MEYIEFQKQSENIINVKRALYYFELAAQADKKHDAEIYLYIAACKQEILDYVGAYEAICKCGEIIEQSENIEKDFSRKFLSQYYERRGKLAPYNGKHFEAAECYEKASNFADDDSKFALASSALYSLNFLDIPSEDLAQAHFKYQEILNDIQPFTTYHEKNSNSRIKVGYVSADFRKHAVFTIILGITAAHNRKKFEVTCYNLNDKDDMYTNIFRDRIEHFISVKNLSYKELAEKIHNDKIDILVDLSGHSAGNALPTFAYKPAPIQISGIGYMATTGLQAMDYFITDEIVDPPGEHEKYFTEKLLYLPSQFCYAARTDVSTPDGAPCKKNNFVTYGTICRYSKINDDMLKIWKMILDKVPDAKFIMRAQEFTSISTIDQAYLRMKNLGFNMDQISLQPAVDNYLEVIKDVDLILDAYPYVGGSTTFDAIYMGVPVLTIYGERRSTRFGLSILKNIGMETLAVNSVEDYISRAVAMSIETDTLDVLHKNLRNMLQNPNTALNPIVYTKLLEQKFTSFLED